MLTLRPHQQRALAALENNTHGQVIVPTGGGKTIIMIKDAARRLTAATTPQTIVVVAPRILLANQLCDCLLYTSPSPRDRQKSRMPSSA